MPLKGYGVLKGRPIDTMFEKRGGHLEILVEANGEKYRIATNVRSMAMPPELKYSIFKDFHHPIINELVTLEEGVTLKAPDLFFAEAKCRLLQNAMYVGCCKTDLGGYTPKPL